MSLRGTFRELRDPMLFRRMHAQAASAGQTVAARQEHLDPRTRGRVVMYYWRHAFEHLRGVGRAPLSLGTRVRLAGVVLRSMIQSRDSLGRELVRAVQQIVRRTIGGWAATKRA